MPKERAAFRIILLSLGSIISLSLLTATGCARLHGKADSSAPASKKAAASRSGGIEKLLFDGKTLSGWTPTEFAGAGQVEVKNGQILLHGGALLTGINWTNEPPKGSYELSLEAMKVQGNDFFCAVTAPGGGAHFTFVCGGWGGGVVGISSIDGMDASENDTTKVMNFEKDKWYAIRLRVTPKKIEAWLDNEKLVDQSIEERRVSMRAGEIEMNVPLGIATYQTTAALRNIRLRSLPSE
jgi:hypothetical protein